MSLASLIDNTSTDKNTVHSYLELYETLLSPKKDTAKNILEIGIGDFKEKNGGSIKLWKDYFPNAKIYALDILPKHRVLDEIINDKRVVLFTSTNAYDEKFFNENFLNKNLKFDLLLDDGPHTLESMKTFIRLYSKVMTDDGILIVEDIQSIDWWPILYREVPQHLKKFVKPYDLRKNKNRYDDMVFTIDKSS
jgi:8-demethyl-8-alpha-L-rhamnosyltetracenomycin-C 2'-O-methyltransferase